MDILTLHVILTVGDVDQGFCPRGRVCPGTSTWGAVYNYIYIAVTLWIARHNSVLDWSRDTVPAAIFKTRTHRDSPRWIKWSVTYFSYGDRSGWNCANTKYNIYEVLLSYVYRSAWRSSWNEFNRSPLGGATFHHSTSQWRHLIKLIKVSNLMNDGFDNRRTRLNIRKFFNQWLILLLLLSLGHTAIKRNKTLWVTWHCHVTSSAQPNRYDEVQVQADLYGTLYSCWLSIDQYDDLDVEWWRPVEYIHTHIYIYIYIHTQSYTAAPMQLLAAYVRLSDWLSVRLAVIGPGCPVHYFRAHALSPPTLDSIPDSRGVSDVCDLCTTDRMQSPW